MPRKEVKSKEQTGNNTPRPLENVTNDMVEDEVVLENAKSEDAQENVPIQNYVNEDEQKNEQVSSDSPHVEDVDDGAMFNDTPSYIDKTVSYELIEQNRERYLIDIDGKDFVVFKGLLDIAHKFGLSSIQTKIIKLDTKEQQCIVEAIVEYQDGTTFVGHGHADPSNLVPKLVPSYIAMAETRAIARALRFGNNVGLTASDELPEKSAASLMGDNSTFTKVSNNTANKILSYLDNDKKYEKVLQIIQKQFGVNSILDLSEKEAEAVLKFLENNAKKNNV